MKMFNRFWYLIFTIVFLSASHCVYCDSSPTVALSLGKIRGENVKTNSGVNYYSFRGIPFAEPPVGELRFAPPVPVKPWNGTFEAVQDLPLCPQPFLDPTEKSEDCLRLNVFTKNISITANKPVIVYIFPGGFYSGGGRSEYFGPEYLMQRDDIVLVSINHRIAILGFLSTGTKEAPGNNGLKDQVIALRWVRDHIRSFGGDPNSVTLMGYSSGGRSITLHMVSPMSKGLFHRAIVMSGSSIAQWEIPTNQLGLVKKQARLLNCQDNNIQDMIKCLKKKNATDIAKSFNGLYEYAPGIPTLVWKPVIEPDFGQERFLTDNPTNLFKIGDFMRIPVLAGVTKYEHLKQTIKVTRNETLRTELNVNFSKWAPVCFMYEEGTPRSKLISAELKEQFLRNKIINNDNTSFFALSDLFVDGIHGFGMHRFVQLASAHTTVFYYQFDYAPRYSYSYTYYPDDKPFGAVHKDDLLYLFVDEATAPIFIESDPEYAMVQRLTGFVTKFAKDGNPNSNIDPYLRNITWQPMSAERFNYLHINDTPTMENHLNTERYLIWDDLFPIDADQTRENKVSSLSLYVLGWKCERSQIKLSIGGAC